MIIVPEEACPGLLVLDDAFAGGRAASSPPWPAATPTTSRWSARRSATPTRSTASRAASTAPAQTLGVKAGGYWPHNLERGLGGNHQSTVFLFDPDTGRPTAMVGGNYLTAARTAASAAVSIKHLARPDAKVLGMVGAGHQSAFQMRAAARQRDFERVVGWNLHPEMLARLAETAAELGLPFEAVDLDRLGAEADVIITITSSFAPILTARPGQARHPPRLHGHRHQGQAGGRGRAPRRGHRLHRRGRPVGHRSARRSTPSPPA